MYIKNGIFETCIRQNVKCKMTAHTVWKYNSFVNICLSYCMLPSKPRFFSPNHFSFSPCNYPIERRYASCVYKRCPIYLMYCLKVIVELFQIGRTVATWIGHSHIYNMQTSTWAGFVFLQHYTKMYEMVADGSSWTHLCIRLRENLMRFLCVSTN